MLCTVVASWAKRSSTLSLMMVRWRHDAWGQTLLMEFYILCLFINILYYIYIHSLAQRYTYKCWFDVLCLFFLFRHLLRFGPEFLNYFLIFVYIIQMYNNVKNISCKYPNKFYLTKELLDPKMAKLNPNGLWPPAIN